MKLYRLTLATMIQRKVWIIALVCALLLPAVLPYLTPYETNPTLVEPARAQAAWVCLWVITAAWLFFQAARFGDETSRSGIGAYFLSSGTSGLSQMIQIWLACLTFLLPLVAITLGVCFFGAMPSGGAQAQMWVATNLQYAALFLLVVTPLMMVAVSVGSRFGSTVGYLIPLCMSIYGMYGVGYLAMMTEVQSNLLLDWLYVVSPHYHLADLTPRLIFKQGSMLSSEFLQLVLYFAGIKIVLAMFSSFTFQPRAAT